MKRLLLSLLLLSLLVSCTPVGASSTEHRLTSIDELPADICVGDRFRIVLEGDMANRWLVKRYSESKLEWLDYYVRAIDILPDDRYREPFWFEAKRRGAARVVFVTWDTATGEVTKKLVFWIRVR